MTEPKHYATFLYAGDAEPIERSPDPHAPGQRAPRGSETVEPRGQTHLQRVKMANVQAVDGDTVIADLLRVRIRLYGIKAPERGEPGGAEAKRYLGGLLARYVKSLRAELRAFDGYGRVVSRAMAAREHSIGQDMLDAGHATRSEV